MNVDADVDAYIAALPEPARARLLQLCALVREEAPQARERMAYGMPTWHHHENLVHLGGYAKHVGIYPAPEAILVFAEELTSYPASKGAIQIPHERELPLDLLRRIVRWRVGRAAERVAEKTAAKAAARAAKKQGASRG